MIKETLSALLEKRSLNETASALEISSDELKSRIELLTSMRYLQAEKSQVTCDKSCSFCFLSSNTDKELVNGYSLTKKGKRILNSNEN